MKQKQTSIVIAVVIIALLVADQALKIWVKTNFHLGEALVVIPDWFQLLFVENNGAAFGMQITPAGNFDWGKLALSLFRLVLVGGLCYYTFDLIRKKAPMGVVVVHLLSQELSAISSIAPSMAWYSPHQHRCRLLSLEVRTLRL